MDKVISKRRKRQREKQCNDHELSIEINKYKSKCPNCGVTKDIRKLGNDPLSTSAASNKEYARSH